MEVGEQVAHVRSERVAGVRAEPERVAFAQ